MRGRGEDENDTIAEGFQVSCLAEEIHPYTGGRSRMRNHLSRPLNLNRSVDPEATAGSLSGLFSPASLD